VQAASLYFRLFAASSTPQDHVDFLTKYAGLQFVPRTTPDILLSESDVRDGDYLAIMKLQGQHGGANVLITLGTGGMSGSSREVADQTLDAYLSGVFFLCRSLGNGVAR